MKAAIENISKEIIVNWTWKRKGHLVYQIDQPFIGTDKTVSFANPDYQ
ncbi:hypothetical protein H3V17_01480 [Bartonella sp. M0283]|nr:MULTISPECIES: hypothetical protein [Bartonella]MBI0162323.1 hypothetical protein [Bartonella sp. M0283]